MKCPTCPGCASVCLPRLRHRPPDAGDGRKPQIVPYLDMPLQHAHPMTLRRMRRPANMDWVYRTLARCAPPSPWRCAPPSSSATRAKPKKNSRPCSTLSRRSSSTTWAFSPSPLSRAHQRAAGRPHPAGSQRGALRAPDGAPGAISLERNQSFVGQTQPVLVEGYNDGISVGAAPTTTRRRSPRALLDRAALPFRRSR
jgi:ribosomal protein S12 methylthiotransferase